MALDELHARRLATVASVFGSALDRMELVLKSLESAGGDEPSRVKAEHIRLGREKMATVRSRLSDSLKRFSIQLRKPEPGQVLAAELSTLWVVLENARPERMKGYGREFSPSDKADWENLIEGLMGDIKEMRRVLVKGSASQRSDMDGAAAGMESQRFSA
jgi:hypothetical protein